MSSTNVEPAVGTAAKAGALLFVLWGILHIWVGAEGVHQYLASGAHGQWDMLLGGANAPRAAFQHTTDPMTANVHAHLILNFCLDVGGYGLLGLAVARSLWRRGSWEAYLVGLVVIGVADLAFLFSQVTSGIITADAGTVGGPVIWAIACVVTPFGLAPLRKTAVAGAPNAAMGQSTREASKRVRGARNTGSSGAW